MLIKSGVLALAIAAAAVPSAKADTFNYSFAGPNVFGSGTLTGTDSSPGVLSLSSITGTVTDNDPDSLIAGDTFTISGLSSFAGADNEVFFNGGTVVDTAGVSSSTIGGPDFNLFFYNGSYYLLNASDNPGGLYGQPTPGNELVLTLTATPIAPAGAPAPLAGAGLLSFLGAGGIAARKRAKRVIAGVFGKQPSVA